MVEQGSIALISEAPLLRVEGVRKRFGGVNALRGVSLEILSGEVHALLGENGAGKSTLIKILSGVHVHDGGSIEIDGKPVSFSSPAQSRDAGVAVVYQDLSLVESLSVADNLLLGREPQTRLGFLKKRQLVAQAEAFLKSQNIPLDARAMVGSLPFAYRQMTEIAKALMGDVRLLILDEPTSALTDDEEKILFEAIRAVAARGVGVIYVTHRLNEVFRISNRVTVFRDGQNAGTFVTAQTNMRQLVGAIVGPDHAVLKADGAASGQGQAPSAGSSEKPVLELKGVSNDRLDGASLELRAGEIHGLAGLIGSGRTEILQTIFGLRPIQSGEASLDGVSLKGTDPAAAIGQGIALVPEDRHVQGLVLEHSIERNLTLPRLPYFSRLGWLQRRPASEHANAAMRRLAVKAPSASTMVKNLSGGNQQKVVFGKWNEPRPRVLLLDEPTVGVDVGAREEIYGVIRTAAAAGSGVLLVSSDLSELLQLCDRISIVVDGRITRTIARPEFGSAEDLHHLIQLSQPSEEHAA
ncbi:sugar ABC transporter ATP-binding protein [Mesorhizobium sp. WSM4307]|uniref:sugar ABC transporter ATP-binding protein n=1 Tax=unclassified Mesorhizobium TaxID=325217 RepID=UPI000BB078FB|nr:MULTISPECIES: sugar ABC transporter ATP-binding protein [unclassified Mesorhizobium]PBB23474.1 sugar ABC transporter [Mesorhizobium sp. WSM4304]PBB72321.1 sugar ABC transporter [Mesorhizobium sp. WSM4308]TRC77510.1 sugar ABC transporter ATP-binding protein [Mesorhizobium sp. WSM4315]TRC80151.1 sugar ABC transporter ATP-binding protein [Mesorhizobium sp. WSM4307]